MPEASRARRSRKGDRSMISGVCRDSLPAKALSIRQPWAWAILHAGKDIENRLWATRYRGPVCIHAAKGAPVGSLEFSDAADFITGMTSLELPPAVKIPRGGIVGVAEIVDCVTESEGPWFFGKYGFVLKNVEAVDFIPVKGALGFFDWRNNL